ncbi:hypothetical protein L2Y94_02450 [Luteibacter aegosomatis]|uniref:hypothetical protein n=1 Tax=Luteibacter aegosomatis TaxID=2911537 RepID=UPI001FFBA806|nr:hypothetical protein [Luteibacter aegosomatis]UPG86248.1 hypothetical protein L2Y94_02450 [Luteibacter aegosomatis]
MTLFRKSLTHQIAGRSQRMTGAMTHDRTREFTGAARQYVGDAGMAALRAGRQVKRHPRTALAVGLGVAAITATWLLVRRRPEPAPQRDEHDPFHHEPAAANDEAVVPGETGLY